MPAGNRSLVALALILGTVFVYGLWRMYDLRFSAGDIYPPYSSLRADPLGAMAFYESVGALPGFEAERNFLGLTEISKGQATVFFLGLDSFIFRTLEEDRIKEYETLAAGGARVALAMEPVRRASKKSEQPPKQEPEPTALEKRWGVTFDFITRPDSETPEPVFGQPKLTALFFRYKDQRLTQVELPFGKGAVVLLANSYPLSNEALAGDRDAKLLVSAIGDNRKVIFDEHHFGISDEGGVATLARKYHLGGVAAALLVLLALFIWKNMTSFLPPRPTPEGDTSVAAKDAGAGLANLLRRNIANKHLLTTCVEQWEKSQHGGRYYSPARIARARTVAHVEGDPVQAYRKVAGILADRSDS